MANGVTIHIGNILQILIATAIIALCTLAWNLSSDFNTAGKKFSEEHRKNLSEAHKGKKQTKEFSLNQSKQRSGKLNPMYGKKHTEESKKKMSSIKLGNQHALGNKSYLGNKHTEETKRKMSKKRIQYWKENKL